MKKKLTLLVALTMVAVMTVCGCSCSNSNNTSADKKMVIGDTTFNAENSEETVNPHNSYNGWA